MVPLAGRNVFTLLQCLQSRKCQNNFCGRSTLSLETISELMSQENTALEGTGVAPQFSSGVVWAHASSSRQFSGSLHTPYDTSHRHNASLQQNSNSIERNAPKGWIRRRCLRLSTGCAPLPLTSSSIAATYSSTLHSHIAPVY